MSPEGLVAWQHRPAVRERRTDVPVKRAQDRLVLGEFGARALCRDGTYGTGVGNASGFNVFAGLTRENHRSAFEINLRLSDS